MFILRFDNYCSYSLISSSDSYSLPWECLESSSVSVFCCWISSLLVLLLLCIWLAAWVDLVIVVLVTWLLLLPSSLVQRLLVISVIHWFCTSIHASHHSSIHGSTLESHLFVSHGFELSVSIEADSDWNHWKHKPDYIHCHSVRIIQCAVLIISPNEFSILDL